MELKEITITDFVLLQASWTPKNCLRLLQRLQATYAIVSHRDIHDRFYLFKADDLSNIIKSAPHVTQLYDAIATSNYKPIPGLAGASEAEDAPDLCIVLDDGYPIGFFDASIPPDEITRHNERDGLEIAPPSLLVDAPESVLLDEAISCLVWIAVGPIDGMQASRQLPIPAGETVDVLIQGRQGIAIVGKREDQLIVPAQDETRPIRFRVQGVKPGLGEVKIFIFYKGQALEALSLNISVIAPTEEAELRHNPHPMQDRMKIQQFGPHPDFTFPLFEHQLKEKPTQSSQTNASDADLGQTTRQKENTQANINRCDISWEQCDAAQLVLNLQVHNARIEANTPLQIRMATELHTLLELLFYDFQAIIVEEFTHGFSGSRVLRIYPHSKDRGGARPVVVKFGDIPDMQREYQNYMNEVQGYIGEGRSTVIYKYQETLSLGGVIYSLQGSDFERIQSFGAFYQQAEFLPIQQVLDTIFLRLCGRWYDNRQPLQPLNLTEHYQKPTGNMLLQYEDSMIKQLPFVQFQEHLIFAAFQPPNRVFTNPFHLLHRTQAFVRSVYTSTTHGDLNQNNVLIDDIGYPWLIDFQDTGRSHILRDITTLDTVIRFQMVAADQATLADFFSMEQKLYSARQFSQIEELKSLDAGSNPALNKAYKTVLHLRSLVNQIAPKHTGDGMSEYYIALFYLTMRTLTYSNLAREQRERALLSASLLADIIG